MPTTIAGAAALGRYVRNYPDEWFDTLVMPKGHPDEPRGQALLRTLDAALTTIAGART
jgi:hypothetical protein